MLVIFTRNMPDIQNSTSHYIMDFFFVMILLCFVSCKNDSTNDPTATTTGVTTTAATTTAATTADPKIAELTQYLSTVTYNNFELTGSNEPYFMGRWFEKDISGTKHIMSRIIDVTAA